MCACAWLVGGIDGDEALCIDTPTMRLGSTCPSSTIPTVHTFCAVQSVPLPTPSSTWERPRSLVDFRGMAMEESALPSTTTTE